MRKIGTSLLIILLIIIAGYIFKDVSVNTSEAKIEDRFVKIQEWDNFSGTNFVMYDKETKVQYYVFTYYNHGGGITVLVDAEGKPLLYKGE
jgi:hypothetical protein